MSERVTERLSAVAIQRDGEVLHRGFRSHWQLRAALNPDDPDPRHGLPGDVEGFITSLGRFVDRREAKDVAIACGQLSHRWKTVSRALLSSDINWDAGRSAISQERG